MTWDLAENKLHKNGSWNLDFAKMNQRNQECELQNLDQNIRRIKKNPAKAYEIRDVISSGHL